VGDEGSIIKEMSVNKIQAASRPLWSNIYLDAFDTEMFGDVVNIMV